MKLFVEELYCVGLKVSLHVDDDVRNCRYYDDNGYENVNLREALEKIGNVLLESEDIYALGITHGYRAKKEHYSDFNSIIKWTIRGCCGVFGFQINCFNNGCFICSSSVVCSLYKMVG